MAMSDSYTPHMEFSVPSYLGLILKQEKKNYLTQWKGDYIIMVIGKGAYGFLPSFSTWPFLQSQL